MGLGGPGPAHVALLPAQSQGFLMHNPPNSSQWIAHRFNYLTVDAVNVPLGACNITYAVPCLLKLMRINTRGCNVPS